MWNMIYSKDFVQYYRKSDKTDYKTSFKANNDQKSEVKTVSPEIENTLNANDVIKASKMPSFIFRYCNNTSIHGIKYFVGSDLNVFERIIWIFLVTAALAGVVYASLLLSEKFSSSLLSTVVESTIYPVYEIPFPAVTICNSNRFNWKRVENSVKRVLPNASEKEIKVYYAMMRVFNGYEYGSFDEFAEVLKQPEFDKLNHINITELYEEVMYKCEEMFSGKCWWRNKYLNCCTIFERQRSEYGICYSFNSAITKEGAARMARNESFPRRSSSSGDWSALRIVMTTALGTSNNQSQTNGLIIIITHPLQWPNTGNFVPSGSVTSVVIKPSFSYTTPAVHGLMENLRQCVYEDDSHREDSLPGLPYFRQTCISACKQRHLVKYCNCSMEIMFPIGHYPSCKLDSLKCFFLKNDILNYEKPAIINKYFNDEEEGMVCNCLPKCNHIEYTVELATNSLSTVEKDSMTLDFHFQQSAIVKYRTDVTFGFLDLMVGFGGIAGLFLGCSILSGVEILYFLLTGLSIFFIKCKRKLFYGNKGNVDILSKPNNVQPKKPNLIKNLQVLRISSIPEDFDKHPNKY